MAGRRIITPTRNPVVDENGSPVSGAKIYFYAPGTLTPKTVYQDQALTTPHAHPIVANGSGVWPTTWADEAEAFDFAIRTSDGAAITGLRDLTNLMPAKAIADGLLEASAGGQAVLGLSGQADKVAYFTGTSTAALTSLTEYGRDVIAAASPQAAQDTLALTKTVTRANMVSVYPRRTQPTLIWFEPLRLSPAVQSFERVSDGQVNVMTQAYVEEWVDAMAAKGLDIIIAYSGYFGYWFYPRDSYPTDYDTGLAGQFWHDKIGGSAAYPNIADFDPIQAIIDRAASHGREVWVGLSRAGDSYFSVDAYSFNRDDFRPTANLTFSALTVGTGRTVTASSGSTFLSSYIGRTLRADAGGKAIITGYTSGSEVTVQILEEFTGNPASGAWRLNLSDMGEGGFVPLTFSGTAPSLTATASSGNPFWSAQLNKIMTVGAATARVTGLSGSPDAFGFYPAVTLTVISGTFPGSAAIDGWTCGDDYTTRFNRGVQYHKEEAAELIALYPGLTGFYLPHEWDDMTTALPFLQAVNLGATGLRQYGKRLMAAVSIPIDLPYGATQAQWEAFGENMAASGLDVINEQSVTGAGGDYQNGDYEYIGSSAGPTGQFKTMTQIETQSLGIRRARDHGNAWLNAEGRQIELWFGVENWMMDGPGYENDYPYVAATASTDGTPADRVKTEIQWGTTFYDRTALYAGFGLFDPPGLTLQTQQSFHGRSDYRTRARAAWDEFADMIDVADAAFLYRPPELLIRASDVAMSAAQNIDTANEVMTIGTVSPQMPSSEIEVGGINIALQDDDTPGAATTITAKSRLTIGSTNYDGPEITLHVGAEKLGRTITLPPPSSVRPRGETVTLKAVLNRSTASDTFNALGWASFREVVR